MHVYSWNDLVDKKYASVKSLRRAHQLALRALHTLHGRGWLVSGGVFGSVARGDLDAGSDLDVIVISNPQKQAEVERFLSRSTELSLKRLGVDPQIIHITQTEAQNGTHSLSPYFVRHLRRLESKHTVGKPPSSFIRVSKWTAIPSATREIAHLQNKVRKSVVRLDHERAKKGEAYYRMLGGAVNATVNAARRMLDISGDLSKKDSDSKRAVIEGFQSAFPESQANVHLVAVARASREYKHVLNQVIRSIEQRTLNITIRLKPVYEEAVKDLEHSVIAANQFFTAANPIIARPYRVRVKRTLHRWMDGSRRRRK